MHPFYPTDCQGDVGYGFFIWSSGVFFFSFLFCSIFGFCLLLWFLAIPFPWSHTALALVHYVAFLMRFWPSHCFILQNKAHSSGCGACYPIAHSSGCSAGWHLPTFVLFPSGNAAQTRTCRAAMRCSGSLCFVNASWPRPQRVISARGCGRAPQPRGSVPSALCPGPAARLAHPRTAASRSAAPFPGAGQVHSRAERR